MTPVSELTRTCSTDSIEAEPVAKFVAELFLERWCLLTPPFLREGVLVGVTKGTG
ncbi:MAG: hypothetical protein WBD20_01440 [Pirellulaceae bacterium]